MTGEACHPHDTLISNYYRQNSFLGSDKPHLLGWIIANGQSCLIAALVTTQSFLTPPFLCSQQIYKGEDH